MNEDHILKYLDNELSEKEKEAFEEQLRTNPALKRKHDEVEAKRQATYEAIGLLNPPEPVIVPDYENLKSPGKKRLLFPFSRWRVAAAILILAVAAAGYFFLQHDEIQERAAATHHNMPFFEEVSSYSEIDFYISPNRCWHRRQLIWTYISNQP